MAKINNAQVIQKLVDELKLYPGKDLIPSELADKVLAVFQVNDQEVSVKTPTANVVVERDGSGASAVIYTTAATGKFYLTNVQLAMSSDLTANIFVVDVRITIDGVTSIIAVARQRGNTLANGGRYSNGVTASLNLQNPILIDKATDITINQSNINDIQSSVVLVGYTEEE